MKLTARWALASLCLVSAAACATAPEAESQSANAEPYASTYAPLPYHPVLIRNATVIDGAGGEQANADILFQDGEIVGVGPNLAAPEGAEVIDGTGRFVTPGIIDAHSHLGVYPSPAIEANSDGNEATDPNTAQVWAEHSVWPMDPGFSRAVAGGVTTLHILPGSANLFGGRGVTVHPVLGARTVREMKFPDAPQSLKMACGENPSRVYGGNDQFPSTDMANVAGWRQAWINAEQYRREWDAYNESGEGDPPDRDLQMDTLADVLRGNIIVQWHCYRADQMATAIAISQEFDFQIAAFHHAVEAYKIPDLLAEADACAAVWADWWGFKIEAYDSINENLPFVDAGGACGLIHSDSEVGIQRLNQEVAKTWADARRAGLDISRAEAWTWLTQNPARALRIEEETGTLEAGKNADVVLWSEDPFSTYAVAERVYIDGALVYQRGAPRAPDSDFEFGQTYQERGQ
ncbi:MAG: amidohydrolase family protein [Hyphomonadaceae bacterium]|nr:amidohydrolase family protein [Hyphomonadaceae bacterium]